MSSVWCPSPPTAMPMLWWWKWSNPAPPATPVPRAASSDEVYVSPELKQFSWQGLYRLIKGRKTDPKEGSYTTYLFQKGLDKILKKVGEECTEVIIAGRKEDRAETIYEIADLAYHVMVLMVQMGITVEDITRISAPPAIPAPEIPADGQRAAGGPDRNTAARSWRCGAYAGRMEVLLGIWSGTASPSQPVPDFGLLDRQRPLSAIPETGKSTMPWTGTGAFCRLPG